MDAKKERTYNIVTMAHKYWPELISCGCMFSIMERESFFFLIIATYLCVLVTVCTWLHVWTSLWTLKLLLWARKKEEKCLFYMWTSILDLPGQTVFTVGIPHFQGDWRQIRYLISLGFGSPIHKNSPEQEFRKLKNINCVRLLGLFVCLLAFRCNHR